MLLTALLVCTVAAAYPFHPRFYNLIDVTPNCFAMGLCAEYGEWGKSIASVHPSSEERALLVLRNIARLFPSEYRASKYGAYEWGYKGSATWEWDSNGFCALAAASPVYSYSMGVQASRFHAWDKFTCDDAIGHETCASPNRCDRFGGCSFSERSRTFIPLGGIWAKAEGVHGMNNGFDGGHCSAIFDPNYKFFGIGYWPSMSSATYLYIKNGPPRD